MTTQSITVPEIHCSHCKMSIEEAVSNLAGVQAVEVEIEPRTVNLTYDEGTVGMDEIKAAIEAVGYEVPDQA